MPTTNDDDPPNFDRLLEERIGDFGPYQIRTLILLLIPACFLNAWQLFDLVFVLYSPEKSCLEWNYLNWTDLEFSNISLVASDPCDYDGKVINLADFPAQNSNSTVRLRCLNWTVDTRYFDRTLRTQFSDNYCSDQVLFKNILFIFTITSIFGCIIVSILQDTIGRKPTFIVALTLSLIGQALAVLAPNLKIWLLIRCVQALLGNSTYSLPFVWIQEFVGSSRRTLVNFLLTLGFSLATVSLGLIAWACRTWIELDLWTSLPFVLLYSYYFLIDESPRWLLSAGKYERAKEIILKIARVNKRGKTKNNWKFENNEEEEILKYVDEIIKFEEKSEANPNQMEEATTPTNSTSKCASFFRTFHLMDFIKYRNLRLKFLLLSVVWIANALIYSSMAFNAPNLKNMFVAYIAQASVEAPACIFNLLLSNRIGRIPPIILSMSFSSLSCLMCIPAYVYGWNDWTVVILAALAKFGVCIAYNILYQATGELYPTSVRGTGIGLNSTAGGFFVGIMPYILASGSGHDSAKWTPMAVLGTLVGLAAICCCFLPESMDRPMPQTAQEAELVSKVGVANVKEHVRNVMGACRRKR